MRRVSMTSRADSAADALKSASSMFAAWSATVFSSDLMRASIAASSTETTTDGCAAEACGCPTDGCAMGCAMMG